MTDSSSFDYDHAVRRLHADFPWLKHHAGFLAAARSKGEVVYRWLGDDSQPPRALLQKNVQAQSYPSLLDYGIAVAHVAKWGKKEKFLVVVDTEETDMPLGGKSDPHDNIRFRLDRAAGGMALLRAHGAPPDAETLAAGATVYALIRHLQRGGNDGAIGALMLRQTLELVDPEAPLDRRPCEIGFCNTVLEQFAARRHALALDDLRPAETVHVAHAFASAYTMPRDRRTRFYRDMKTLQQSVLRRAQTPAMAFQAMADEITRQDARAPDRDKWVSSLVLAAADGRITAGGQPLSLAGAFWDHAQARLRERHNDAFLLSLNPRWLTREKPSEPPSDAPQESLHRTHRSAR